jgi:hypothetical protein
MTESVLGEPETAIDAQLRVEKLLEILKQTGSVSSYQTYLGVNKIRVTGSPQALELLSGWLEVTQLQKYQPDQPWEQPFLAELDISAPAGTGGISGQVIRQDNSDPIYGIEITAYRKTGPTSWVVAGKTNTDAAGNYSLGNLDGGIYVVYFDDPNGSFVSEFYNDKPNFTAATNFTVTDGQTTADIDASMTLAGKIAGRVTKISDGNPAADTVVSAYLSGDSLPYSSDVTSSDGTYTIGGLEAGTYNVRFKDGYIPPRYLTEYYDNVVDRVDAMDISVAAGGTTADIDASLGSYGWITGTVTAGDSAAPIENIGIDVWQYNSDSMNWDDWVSYGTTDASGVYDAYGLVTRDYRVEFSDLDGQFVGEFYNDELNIESATDVHVELGAQTADIDAALSYAVVTKTLTLAGGWNLISIPLNPVEPAPEDVLAGISGGYDQVFAYDGCVPEPEARWLKYIPGGPPPFNTLTTMDARHGYWLNATDPMTDTLSVSGSLPLTTSIDLCTGWNLIGYASWNERPITDVLADIDGKYSLVYAYDASDVADPWKKYSPPPDPPIANDLNNMQPWFGYWINITEPANLTIFSR